MLIYRLLEVSEDRESCKHIQGVFFLVCFFKYSGFDLLPGLTVRDVK